MTLIKAIHEAFEVERVWAEWYRYLGENNMVWNKAKSTPEYISVTQTFLIRKEHYEQADV